MLRGDPEPPPSPSLGTCSSAGLGASPRGCRPLAEPSQRWGCGVPPLTRPVPHGPRRAALPLPPLPKWQLPLICHIPWPGSPSPRPPPRPCSPAPLAKIERGQCLSILAASLGGDPAFLPAPPSPSPAVSPDRDRETLVACGGKGHRHASCNARPRVGASPAGPLCPIPSRGWAAEEGPLFTRNPSCGGGCKHSETSFLPLSPCLATLGTVGPGQSPQHPAVRVWGAPPEPSPELQAASDQGQLVPRAASPPLGKAGLPHLPVAPWHTSGHPAPAALAGGCKSGEQDASNTASCFPAANQPPLALAQPAASSSGASPARRSQDPPSLGGWGTSERDVLLDPQPGGRAAEEAPGSLGTGGEAARALGTLFPARAALQV